jgi:uncharacterized membrane protein YhaH (DUF805 family)
LLAFAFDRLVGRLADGAGILPFLDVLLISWSAGCLSRRRLHDMGRSGLLIAVFLALYIALVLATPCLPPLAGLRNLLVPLAAILPALAWATWLALIPSSGARRQPSQALAA